MGSFHCRLFFWTHREGGGGGEREGEKEKILVLKYENGLKI